MLRSAQQMCSILQCFRAGFEDRKQMERSAQVGVGFVLVSQKLLYPRSQSPESLGKQGAPGLGSGQSAQQRAGAVSAAAQMGAMVGAFATVHTQFRAGSSLQAQHDQTMHSSNTYIDEGGFQLRCGASHVSTEANRPARATERHATATQSLRG